MKVSCFRIPILALGLLATLLPGTEKLDVKDPAPPKVYELPDPVTPEAKSFSRLTFHKAAKPLSSKAKTQSWPRFLGATDNAISAETHLEKTFSKGGPVKVWEIETGTGYTCPTVANGRMYLFHRWEDQETVECINPETGK
ncbi:MAG: hypothetical protein HOL08_10980, partial [Opitutae bacterium]|nr:hypothetical protein [Opitutae bacterium]